MRRALDFSKRAIQRVNLRVAILMVVVAAGGFAVWQGYRHLAAQAEGPTKQIATGVPAAALVDGAALPVAPALSYGQAASAANQSPYQVAAYAQGSEMRSGAAVAIAPPPTSAYQPTTSDAPGGNDFRTLPTNPYRSGFSSGGGIAAPAETQTLPATTAVADFAAVVDARTMRGGANARITSISDESPAALAEPQVNAPAEAPQASLSAEASAPAYAAAAAPAYARAAPAYVTPAPTARSISAADLRGTNEGLAAATPGQRQLEGLQQPAIAVEKISPAEIQIGRSATFQLLVRNVGQVPAQNVVITDHVPAGTQLQAARPEPQQGSGGSLTWNLGTMQPGEQQELAVQVLPQTEGEIGSTASVSFSAAATSRSLCTRPQLTIEHTAPPKVLIGESMIVAITVSNPGTGPATGVIIEEDVPDALAHAGGSELEYEVGTLRPGESKRLELSLRAQKAGIVQNLIRARGDGNLAAQHAVPIEVIAPQLQVEVEGPKRRFLARQATYTLQVVNSGTAAAHDVELAAYLPRGMKFVTTDARGQYDPAQHAVFWSLAELPPSLAGEVKLTTLPIEAGEQRLRIESRANLGLVASKEQAVQVEQAAELLHTVKDQDEVIEVGSETSYEIRVTNSGTKAATNVKIAALMPAGMAAISGQGPTAASGDATQIVFEPLPRLNPQEEVIYRVQVQGKQPGDHLVRVQLSSDEWPTAVTREESTRVYQDR